MVSTPFDRNQYISRKHLAWTGIIFVSIMIALSIPHLEPVFVLVAIIGVVNVILVLRYPFWGVLAYLIVFLYRPGEVYPALAPLRSELLLGGLVIVAILLNKKSKTGSISLPNDSITLSLIAFLAVMITSAFTSYWREITIETSINFTKTLVFYYMIIAVIDNRKKFLAFVTVYAIMIGKVAYDSLRMYIAGDYVHTMGIDRLHGATSFGGDPNTLANTMAISIPFIVAAAIYFKNWITRSVLIIQVLGITCLIAITGSRGGLLTFFGVLLGGFIYARQKAVIALSAVVLIAAGWYVLPDQYRERYKTLTEIEDIDQTSSGRWEIWKSGVQMIAARPILGVGAGAFPAALGSGDFGRVRWMQPHNLYIQVMATTGIIGFVVWLGVFIYNLSKRLLALIKQTMNSEEYYWMTLFGKSFVVSLIALFISGIFGHNLYRYNWYMIAGLTLAMCSILARDDKEAAG